MSFRAVASTLCPPIPNVHVASSLGEGPHGVAYLAQRDGSDRETPPYVLKVLASDPAFPPAQVERFLTTARSLQGQRLPGVAAVVDVGTLPHDRSWILSEWAGANSLRAEQRSGTRLTPGQAMSVVREVLRAVRELHDRGVVHGNLKLENVFFPHGTEGSVLLTDVGFDRLRRAEPLSFAADMLATAVLGYELLTGRPPLAPQATLARPSALVEGVSPAVDDFLLRGLGLGEGDRFSDVQAMQQAFDRCALPRAPGEVHAADPEVAAQDLLDRLTHAAPADRGPLFRELAQLYEGPLGDPGEAFGAWVHLLLEAPTDETARLAVARLADAGLGEDATDRWNEATADLEQAWKHASDPDLQVEYVMLLGDWYFHHLARPDLAGRCYAEAIAVRPHRDEGYGRAAELYRAGESWAELAELLNRWADHTSHATTAIDCRVEAAEVRGDRLDDQAGAVTTLNRVLDDAPGHARATVLFERLASGRERSARAVHRARALFEQGDLETAERVFRAAVEADGSSAEAHRGLRAVLLTRGEFGDAAETYEQEAEVTVNPADQATLYAELGALYEERLSDPDKAREAYGRAIKLDATCLPALDGLGGLAFRAERWSEVVRLYGLIHPVLDSLSVEQRYRTHLAGGDAMRELDRLGDALAAYQRAKALRPDEPGVLLRVADVSFEQGAFREAEAGYVDVSQGWGPGATREVQLHVWLRLGETRERLEDFEGAASALRKARELEPNRRETTSALVSVYEASEKWTEAVRALELRLTQDLDADERVERLSQLAELCARRRDDPARAAQLIREALELGGDDRNLLTTLMGLYSEGEQWPELYDVVLRMAALVKDEEPRAKYFLTAGALAQQRLARVSDARNCYQKALALDPTLTAAFEGLSTCLREQGDEGSLIALHEERLAQLAEDGEARASTLATLAELDPQRYDSAARQAIEACIQTNPTRGEPYRWLGQLYVRQKETDAAWCAWQALTVLGEAEPDEEQNYRAGLTAEDEEAKGQDLSEREWIDLIMHESCDPAITRLFRILAPTLRELKGRSAQALGISNPRGEAPPTTSPALKVAIDRAIQLNRIPRPQLYAPAEDAGGLSVLRTPEPAVAFGRGVSEHLSPATLRFVAGRGATLLRDGFCARVFADSLAELDRWIRTTVSFAMGLNGVDRGDALFQKLDTTVSDEARGQLKEAVQRLGAASQPLDLRRWIGGVELTADRVGFVLANRLDAAASVIRAGEGRSAGPLGDRIEQLLRYSVSRDYLEVRRRMGVARPSGT